ncbi:arabinose kinase [Raphidocelis subcapitata]|uniref:Arabinose kinase n=1 Tax=Raphidocelis subcapitata TaxID=307507 RepID=A0A2V0P9E2_9CHLO|nr:arabinose kinase [Raphidocelis subcapitata]|eukprot:GBF96474.1 arabinose kinase [Raphidocelis subcapitata]
MSDTMSECLAHQRPLVFVRRDYFNEEPFLRKMLELHSAAVEMRRRDFFEGHWGPYLLRAAALEPQYSEPTNGAEVVAARLESFSRSAAARPPPPPARAPGFGAAAGAASPPRESDAVRRMRDTVVYGYLMASAKATRVDVPECPDADVIVTRAPGRLDVMGGIADYSGSLMPISEACHVALQRHPAEKQGLWRHMQARHAKLGGAPRPALRVVSYHADTTNRAPAFDMDLDDLWETDGQTGERAPIPYAALRAYFRADPAVSWGGYVAGCLLVLARERGVEFGEGISMLICSDVPEGKGVSSSAALEVAVMSALAAAHGIELAPRELALLCQKAENLVIGAPCGVMDQMAAAEGGAGQLLALLCQPAEVRGHVTIPNQIRFWGIDSGIRHSVGGADYCSVRVGTFMGAAMMRALAAAAEEEEGGGGGGRGSIAGAGGAAAATAARAVSGGGAGGARLRVPRVARSLLLGAAGGGGAQPPPIVDLPPSLFREVFEAALPESITGAEFLERWGCHGDPVTSIEPEARYAVRVPAAHPICEHARVAQFKALLEAGDALNDAAAAARAAAAAAAKRAAAAAGGGDGSRPGTADSEASSSAGAAGAADGAPNGAAAAATAAAPGLPGPLELLGELMLQSHASYSACGLGSDGTSRIVDLVRDHMAAARAAGGRPALFGAKITGGGCGGTVCVMGLAGGPGEAAVAAVAAQYARETGHAPAVFGGSSDGAARLGALRLRWRTAGGRA